MSFQLAAPVVVHPMTRAPRSSDSPVLSCSRRISSCTSRSCDSDASMSSHHLRAATHTGAGTGRAGVNGYVSACMQDCMQGSIEYASTLKLFA